MLYHAGTLDDGHIPKRGKHHRRTRELAIYLLTPGFSTAYHSRTLGMSANTIRKHLAWSRDFEDADPSIEDDVAANIGSITAEDGLKMAQRRGAAHLTWWSRMAIAEFASRGIATGDVAAMFRCSRRTVQLVQSRACLSYDLFSGARRLSSTQLAPTGRWTSNIRRT
jgi:hypothetical protein